MSRPVILGFALDDDNIDKFAAHGPFPQQILQVLEGPHTVVRNRKHRRGLYLVIGRDYSDTCIAVPIEATRDRTLWRPITAWRCKAHERARAP